MYNPLPGCIVVIYGIRNEPIVHGYLEPVPSGSSSFVIGFYGPIRSPNKVKVTYDCHGNVVCHLNGKVTERYTIIPKTKKQKRVFSST